jgi:hypothetical protein
MKLARNAFVVAGLLLAVACGSSTNQPDPAQAAVPTFQGLSAEVSNTASEDAALTPDGTQAQALNGNAEWLPKIRDAIHSLNQGLKTAFLPVEQLVLTVGPRARPGARPTSTAPSTRTASATCCWSPAWPATTSPGSWR